MADRSLRNPEDKNSASSSRVIDPKKRQKRALKSENSGARKKKANKREPAGETKNAELAANQAAKDNLQKRSREVEDLKSPFWTDNDLLREPLRVTRSQWRRSLSERHDQASGSGQDTDFLHSSNPASRSTSRSSSRTLSPVYRTGKVEEGSVLENSRNRSKSPEAKARKGQKSNGVEGLSFKISTGVRKTSRSTSRHQSPDTTRKEHKGTGVLEGEVTSTSQIGDKKVGSEDSSGSRVIVKGKRPLKKGGLGAKHTSADTKFSGTNGVVSGTSVKGSNIKKGHWAAREFEKTASKTANCVGRKRAAPSKSNDVGGKREKKDNTAIGLPIAIEVKSNTSEAAKTGGRLSRTRTSQAQTGERRSTTGSCASSRRSSRRSRAQQEPPNMATDDSRNNTQAESADNEPRVEEPVPGSSGSRDSEANPIEDLEMSRLQALLEARGLPSHLFGNLGPRMHLLLQRTFSSSAGTKAQQLLTGMQSDDEGQQLTSVMEMCQLLVMGNEETLGGFPVKQAVPVLITLLQMEHNFDITNHACRALTYLMEALPRSSAVVVDAIPTFLEKLQIIQCMDVAEQSLTALEMLSRRHGKAILQAGGLNACLLYLDFFSIVAQRCALGIASNCCQSVTPEEFHHVKDAIPILSGRLSNQDKKSLENVCSAFARLVDNFQRDKKLLEDLCAHGLLPNLQQLLMISPPIISTSTFVMVIRMLAVMCTNCPAIAVKLLKQNIADTLRYLLIGNPAEEESREVSNNELIPRTPQELYEITCVISELLPKLPSSGVFAVDLLLVKGSQQNTSSGCWQWRDDRGVWHNYMWVDNRILEAAHQSSEDEISLSTLGRNYIIDFTNMQQINEDTGTIRSIQRKANNTDNSTSVSQDSDIDDTDERKLALQKEPALGESFVKCLLSVMYDVYYSSVGPAVKHKCLSSALKMLYHTSEVCLKPVLEKLPISSYIAGMLTSNDPRVVCCALQKAEILMVKLPDVFHVSFRREGVMHRAKSLSVKAPKSAEPTPEKGKRPHDIRPRAMASAHDIAKVDEAVDSVLMDLTKSPSEGKIPEVTKRKKVSKRSTRLKQSQAAMADDAPSTSSKKSSTTYSRTRAATFTSTTNAPSGSSKTSFFSSFAPRWGRSQSYTSAAVTSGSKERLAKEADENKEKIKGWINQQASQFYVSYFDEQPSGDTHPALIILHRLTKASEDLSLEKDTGITALKEISDVLKEKNEHGASAFEILHSGLIKSLLRYLTIDTPKDAVARNIRIKRFLHVFLGCPDPDLLSTRSIEPSVKPSLPSLVQKLNLCINQLEQFAVKCHDLPGAVTGSRGTSALRFFNTHQIKCNLQRHPECHNLRNWKGGTVKIDPLALVQAVERYLVIRGFGKVREHADDDDSDDEDGTDGEIDEAWGSAVGTGKPNRHYLELVLNGRVLPYDMTIYQAVRQYGENRLGEDKDIDDEQGPLGRASIWSETHTVWYRPINQNNATASQPSTKKRSEAVAASSSSTSSSKASLRSVHRVIEKERSADLTVYLSDTLPNNVHVKDPSLEAICLMRVLYYLNSNWGSFYEVHQSHATVSVTEFLNAKLSAKVSRQLQDPLAIMTGNLPSWLNELAIACPFLFPFENRQQLFYSTTFDRDRALMKLQESVPELASADTADRVTPRLEKKKRTVPRTDLLKQAENVMNDVAGGRAMLEIQYEGEVGSGLGPTLEFYTLVSKELQKADLQIWRGDVVEVPEGDGESKDTINYIHSPCGLFPVPLPKNFKVTQLAKVKSRFRFLGKFVAKAIMDSRMIDLPFSQPFCKWVVGLESTLQLSDIQNIDGTLFKSLNQLNDVVKRKKAIERDPSHSVETLRLELGNLTLDGVAIEDLGLDFVLPGHGNIELKKNGKDIPVTIDNLEEYIKLVVNWTLVEGVSRQFQAFREGLESVFPFVSAQMFYPMEVDLLLCGSRSEKWDVKELIECCRPDHGYTHDSRAVRFLFDILSRYDTEEQRKFLQFITGSPRLPVGGFRSLNPPLTIVRKTVDGASSPDNYLPSVMTCVNYLKLPDYSSDEVMDEKLRTAYTEGKNAFHLS